MDANDYKHIRYLARSFAKKSRYLTEDDYFQQGCLAFLENAYKWDPKKSNGHTKWDYLWLVIGGKLTAYWRTQDSLIRLPQNKFKTFQFDFEDIYDFEFMKKSDCEDCIERMFYQEVIPGLLCCLTDRQKQVIEMRFFQDMTLEDVGWKIGVTRERVRQVEARALRIMRREMCLRWHIRWEDIE